MSSAPKQPDPMALANAQSTINQKAQESSMINQNNPYSSLQYTQTGTNADGSPKYTANTQLTDAQQGLLNTLQSTQQTSGTAGNTLLNNLNLGAAPNFSDQAGGLTQKLLGQETS